MTHEDVARICHETMRAYCEFLDHWQKPVATAPSISKEPPKPTTVPVATSPAPPGSWEAAEQWQRDSIIAGVKFRVEHSGCTFSEQHDAWRKSKLAAGWKFGPVKDSAKKEHPCLVAYEDLPGSQRYKDALFCAVVDALKPALYSA